MPFRWLASVQWAKRRLCHCLIETALRRLVWPSLVLYGCWQQWYGTVVPSYTVECRSIRRLAPEGVEEGGGLEASSLEENQRE